MLIDGKKNMDDNLVRDEKIEMLLSDALEKYVNTLCDIDRIALEVAKRQLESSFEIHKSIGFLKYLRDNKVQILM